MYRLPLQRRIFDPAAYDSRFPPDGEDTGTLAIEVCTGNTGLAGLPNTPEFANSHKINDDALVEITNLDHQRKARCLSAGQSIPSTRPIA